MTPHHLTLAAGAVTYRMTVYYFSGISVDSEIHNHSATDLTFDLAEVVAIPRLGRVARPCVVWRRGSRDRQRTRLYPPDHPWYALTVPGCPMPKGTYIATVKPGERAVFFQTLQTGEDGGGVLEPKSTVRVVPGWHSLQVRNTGLSLGGRPLPATEVTFELETR